MVCSCPEKLLAWPCVRCPPCDRFIPSPLSPRLSTVSFTYTLVCAPEAPASLARAPLARRDLLQPPLVTSTLERRPEPNSDDLIGEPEPDDPSPHREDVGVVVLAGEPRRIEIVAQRRANPDDLVGG